MTLVEPRVVIRPTVADRDWAEIAAARRLPAYPATTSRDYRHKCRFPARRLSAIPNSWTIRSLAPRPKCRASSTVQLWRTSGASGNVCALYQLT